MVDLNINKSDKILIVAPHPDDECIGAGGLMIKYHKQCSVIILTNGNKGYNDSNKKNISDIRKKELISEMKYLNIRNYQFIDIDDGNLRDYTTCLFDIDLTVYNKIFVTNSYDDHIDHQAAYICVVKALREQKKYDTELYMYEVTTPVHHITHYINISSIIEEKMKIIQFHRSQLLNCNYCEVARNLNCFRAYSNCMINSYLECYEMVNNYFEDENPEVSAYQNSIYRQRLTMDIMERWIYRETSINLLKKYFIENNINSVAIYGFGRIGRLVEKCLRNTDINVRYFIDSIKENGVGYPLKIYKLYHSLQYVDIVLITIVQKSTEVELQLEKKGLKYIYLQELLK